MNASWEDPTDVREDATDAAALAGTILDLEAERQASAEQRVVLPDDVLPGVGDDEVTLKDALARGGRFTFMIPPTLVALDELESAALSTLAPDIRSTLGISSGLMVFISAAAGTFLVLGSVPMGVLADRFRRGRIIAWSSLASRRWWRPRGW